MKNILTGIRPTGNLHLGHYFGATKNWVLLQDKYNTFIEIADVQALTDNFNNPTFNPPFKLLFYSINHFNIL